jgi:hypothetical protein
MPMQSVLVIDDDGAKPFGEGLPHEIRKIVEDYDGDTCRAVYTADCAAHVFAVGTS